MNKLVFIKVKGTQGNILEPYGITKGKDNKTILADDSVLRRKSGESKEVTVCGVFPLHTGKNVSVTSNQINEVLLHLNDSQISVKPDGVIWSMQDDSKGTFYLVALSGVTADEFDTKYVVGATTVDKLLSVSHYTLTPHGVEIKTKGDHLLKGSGEPISKTDRCITGTINTSVKGEYVAIPVTFGGVPDYSRVRIETSAVVCTKDILPGALFSMETYPVVVDDSSHTDLFINDMQSGQNGFLYLHPAWMLRYGCIDMKMERSRGVLVTHVVGLPNSVIEYKGKRFLARVAKRYLNKVQAIGGIKAFVVGGTPENIKTFFDSCVYPQLGNDLVTMYLKEGK